MEKLTLKRFRELTAHVPEDAPITFHGYDKGCGIHVYRPDDIWFYPKEAETPSHVVLNPGDTYDGRSARRGGSDDATKPFTHYEVLAMVSTLHRVMNVDEETYDKIVSDSGKSFHFMDTLRKKIAAVATDAPRPEVEISPVVMGPVPTAGYVVCELICQRPSTSVHPDKAAAMKHAVARAMENLTDTEWSVEDKLDRQAEFETTLTDFDRICEGDYEVHILPITNL